MPDYWTTYITATVGTLPSGSEAIIGRECGVRALARKRGAEPRLPPPPAIDADPTIKTRARLEADELRRLKSITNPRR
jgi:hypothetical protein